MKLKKRIEVLKNEMACSKWFRNYTRLCRKGQTTRELDEMACSLLKARMETAALKKECREKTKLVRKNARKVFYVDHIFGFVISDTGQVFKRGFLSDCIVAWITANLCIWWGMLTGRFNPCQSGVRNHFNLYAGCKSASRHTGISEDLLLKPTEEIIG